MVYTIIKRSVEYIILVLAFVLFLIIFSQKILVAKVDVQDIGQEEYDRFVLVEKILNSECAITRGIFNISKIEQNENCQFKDCKVETNVDWGFFIQSKEVELDSKLCKKQNFRPEFKTGNAIPVLLYDGEKKIFHNAHMIIYGPEGIYTIAFSNTRVSKQLSEELINKEPIGDKKVVEIEKEFECDIKSSGEASCKIEAMEAVAHIRTNRFWFFGPSEIPEVIFSIDGKQEVVKPEASTSGIRSHKWHAETFLEYSVKNKEKVKAKVIWKFEKNQHYFGETDFFIKYRVVCPIGSKYNDLNLKQHECVEEKR